MEAKTIKWLTDDDICCLIADVFICHHLALTKAHMTVETELDRIGLLLTYFVSVEFRLII